MTTITATSILVTLLICSCCNADLVVNVLQKGGESYKQTIKASLSDDTVLLYFDSYDGSSTKMVIDFRNEIQLLHTTRLGNQEELDLLNSLDPTTDLKKKKSAKDTNLSLYKSYCFVTKFKPTEFIPVDAMAKLRQKNPWSQRTPERTEPTQNISFDIMLDPTATDWISPVIKEHCSGGQDFQVVTYAVKSEVGEKAVNPEDYLRAVRDLVSGSVVGDESGGCFNDGVVQNRACTCTVSVCIGWYPCALKFCRARNNSSNSSSSLVPGNVVGSSASPTSDAFKTYRCGIHTCRICRNYLFGVRSGFECV